MQFFVGTLDGLVNGHGCGHGDRDAIVAVSNVVLAENIIGMLIAAEVLASRALLQRNESRRQMLY